jgi:HD-GYP domain-containing protein (c-di-GMP phosphodiesterase class II)
MAFNRTYHDAKSFEAIVAEVEAQAGSQFDPAVAAAFLRVVRRQGTEFLRGSAREEGRMPQWRYGKEPVEGASAAAAASE